MHTEMCINAHTEMCINAHTETCIDDRMVTHSPVESIDPSARGRAVIYLNIGVRVKTAILNWRVYFFLKILQSELKRLKPDRTCVEISRTIWLILQSETSELHIPHQEYGQNEK